MNEIIRQLLSKRGIVEEQDIIEYLSPRPRTSYDPRLLYGMKEAVDTILAAVRRGDKIVVYGDYDDHTQGAWSESAVFLYSIPV